MSSGKVGLLAAILVLSGCGGGGGSASSTPPVVGVPPRVVPKPTGGGHTMPVSVNGATCSAGSYMNKPCVEVTICDPAGVTCVAVGDILLDTGSYGLRVFGSLLTALSLPAVDVTGGGLASCVKFADGSADWGPIRTAMLYLGDAGPATTSIHVIDATFAGVPSGCGKADTGPAQAGLNGVLGIGPFLQDCGGACVSGPTSPPIYYACSAAGCAGAAVPLAKQVQNPAALLAGFANGLVLDLPPVGPGGQSSVTGALYFGIGTHLENTPASTVNAYPLFELGGIDVLGQQVNGVNGSGFLDTGSNALYFDPPAGTTLSTCAAPNDSFYCSAATLNGAFSTGSALGPGFSVGVASLNTLLTHQSSNVFANVAGSGLGMPAFDWGLPFYLGRRIYLGFETRTSTLGIGPYQAF